MRKPDFSSHELLIFTMRPKRKYASTHRPAQYRMTWAQVVMTWQVSGEEPIPEDLIGAGFVHFTAFHDVKVEWVSPEEYEEQECLEKRHFRAIQSHHERHE